MILAPVFAILSTVEYGTHLRFGHRVAVGVGFLTVGLSAAGGSIDMCWTVMGTSVHAYAAEFSGNTAQSAKWQATLERQRQLLLVDLASAAACTAIGAAMLRGSERLWSGETASPSALPPVEEPLAVESALTNIPQTSMLDLLEPTVM
jgi:hypothetical protein